MAGWLRMTGVFVVLLALTGEVRGTRPDRITRLTLEPPAQSTIGRNQNGHVIQGTKAP